MPHKHAIEGEGNVIPIYHQVPEGASKDNPAPCIIIYTGLDGYRTELAVWIEGWRQKGCAVIILEIPGTGDSPAFPSDPTSPDRQNSSLLDWVDTQDRIDAKKLVVWGFSTGGFYTIRFAHTHRDRLLGAVALGGGCHHMFDEGWLDNVNHLEYPFEYDLPFVFMLLQMRLRLGLCAPLTDRIVSQDLWPTNSAMVQISKLSKKRARNSRC